MISAPPPISEERRLATLADYQILDTPPEECFDDITYLAAQLCDTQSALISLVDRDRQWFKSRYGMNALQISRHESFCAHAILNTEVLIVEDALEDERFFDNPLVTNEPNIRFYAGAPLTTASGETIGALCVIDKTPRDFSERNEKCLVALAKQVMAQLELRQTATAIRSETQAKSLFLANMSHEIRTPMNAILSCTDLLIDVIEEPDHLKMLSLTRDAASGLMTLINEILNMSKLEFEDIGVRSVPYSLRSVAGDTVQLLQLLAKKSDRVINFELSESVPEIIQGDPDRLRQLLYNLAGNALKFSNRFVSVSIGVTNVDRKESLLIAVKDDGAGISEANRKRIFQQLTQCGPGSGLPESGTGLGLSICESLCSAMKGKIWIEAHPGSGATFLVELPLIASGKTEERHTKHERTCVDSNMGMHSPLKILVAEDSEVNQFIVAAMLGKMGYTADIVSNGREAVEASQTGGYDLILMDIRMPIMGGIEATRRIRESMDRQQTIIALTANAFDEDKNEAISAGMDGFITKPIDLKALSEALDSAGTAQSTF